MADLTVDLTQVENLGKEIRAAEIVALGRLGERLYQHLRAEVPYVTGNLKQGVAPPDIDDKAMTAEITVSARSARTGGGAGTVHYPSGKTKSVQLKPQIAFNYAEVVAKGRPALRPKTGRALLIEVKGTPSGAYIEAGGKIFVVRKSAAAVAPNPYDERAAVKLEGEAPVIVEAVFGELFN
ncbi:MAG: hypothetical protein JSS81_05845 [Acidobacteria bacterium]|nr:hypothetical protein [Acidobacteriota bacterium]